MSNILIPPTHRSHIYIYKTYCSGTIVIPILSRKKLVFLSAIREKNNLEVFRIAWKNSMSSYRQALKAARTEHIHKLIDNNQNNPRFICSTVARLTNKQTSTELNIPTQFNSNDFMNFFTYKIDSIRNTITNVGSTQSYNSISFVTPKEKLQCCVKSVTYPNNVFFYFCLQESHHGPSMSRLHSIKASTQS